MSNWWDDYNDDEIVVLKGILTPFMSQAKSVQVTLAAAHKADDLETLTSDGDWVAKPMQTPLLSGRIYRIRTDFKRPAVGWWTGMDPIKILALKRNKTPYGLCPPWQQNAIKSFKKSGHAMVYLPDDTWYPSDPLIEPDNDCTYRLRADWMMP